MADTSSTATWADMSKCQTAHLQIEESAIGLMRGLNLNQKQKLLELIVKWTNNLEK